MNNNHPAMYKVYLPGGRISLHRNDDFLFTYILSGSGTVTVNEKDISVEKGSSFIIARNKQTVFKPGRDTFLQMLHVHLSESEIEHYLLHNTAPLSLAVSDTCCLKQVPDHLLLQSFAAGIVSGIERGFHANRQLTFLKVQECINIVIYLCPELHHWFFRMNHSQKINLHEFMEKYFQDNLPLEQLAQAAGRSLSTFRRDFLKEFGTTPGKWLLNKRLDEAYKLITQKKLKPSSALLELGFESFSHFSRSFKARFGIQPSLLLKGV